MCYEVWPCSRPRIYDARLRSGLSPSGSRALFRLERLAHTLELAPLAGIDLGELQVQALERVHDGGRHDTARIPLPVGRTTIHGACGALVWRIMSS